MIILLLIMLMTLRLPALPVVQTAKPAPLKLTVDLQPRIKDNQCAPIYQQLGNNQPFFQGQYDLVSKDNGYNAYCLHFTLTNISDKPVKFYVMSCSFSNDNWLSDNAAISFQPWPCRANTIHQIVLNTGEIYQGAMALSAPAKQHNIKFKLAFKPVVNQYTPDDDARLPLMKQSIWSDGLTINQ